MKNGEMVKKIRKDLRATQEEIACETENLSRSAICRIEKGSRGFKREQAVILAKKLNDIKTQKGIPLKYKITPELLLGSKIEDIDLFTEELKEGVAGKNKYFDYTECFKNIDDTLKGCTNELAEALLLKVIEILSINRYKYYKELEKYCSKILRIAHDPQIIVKVNLKLMIAYFVTNNLDAICMIENTLTDELKFCDDETKVKFYFNIAQANYKKENYVEATEYIKKARKIEIKDYELKLLNLEANILLKQKKYKRAALKYLEILESTNDVTSKTNAYSNLCEAYMCLNELSVAEEYINKAMNYVNMVNINYKFNVMLNKLILESKMNRSILDIFIETFEYSKQLSDTKKQKRVMEILIDYYIKIYDIAELQKCLKALNNLEIEIPSKLFKQLIKNSNNLDDVLAVV